jgi:gamma-glutamyltranspeptidase/glutathione hydrolase
MAGMIVAPEPLAAEEGAKVLMKGGNAIDAAVTCAFVEGVVNPQNAGIGGYLVALIRPSAPATDREQPIVVDAPALAGSRVTPDMWQDLIIRPSPEGWGYFVKGKVNDQGYQSVCTPGFVKGIADILARWGTISWAEAIEPAVRLAEEGFMVDEALANGWRRKAAYPEANHFIDYVRGNAEARRIYLKSDGTPYDMGERLCNPDLARTLRHLAKAGPADFYVGELARRTSRDLQANGSFVTAIDLAEYQLRDTEPVVGAYHGYTIVTSPSPHGGPTLLEILNILEGYDLAGMEHNSPDYIYLVGMAMKAAAADRNHHLGDPEFVDVPLAWLTSKERAGEWREHITAGKTITMGQQPASAPGTTHVSVVDKHGNCVALTHSLGMSSGVITPGLGFMYNNSMTNFQVLPGYANSIAPRKGRTTGMTPTIVYKDSRPLLVIGAPGGVRIITSVAQVILNVLDFGMSVNEAVLAPRIDCQGDVMYCQMRIPEYVCAQVRAKHPIERIAYSHGGMGRVQAIIIDPVTGRLRGAADTGCGGMALAV